MANRSSTPGANSQQFRREPLAHHNSGIAATCLRPWASANSALRVRFASLGATGRLSRTLPPWSMPWNRFPPLMPEPRSNTYYYKRARFLTHLPKDRLYTRSHAWLVEVRPGVWRIGLTKFASRMLGDIV